MKRKHYLDSRVIRADELIIEVIGCGGTGSQILSGLAAMNHALGEISGKTITVIAYDADEVSATNIGRQAFFPCDIGRNKADVLINRINHSYGVNWVSRPRFKQASERWNGHFTITCVDSAKARADFSKKIGNRSWEGEGIYWLDIGNKRRDGQIVLGYNGQRGYGSVSEVVGLPYVTELFPELLSGHVEADDLPSCSMEEALRKQSLFINRVMANHALAMVWELLSEGSIDHCGMFVNLKSGKANPVAIDPKVWKAMGMDAKKADALVCINDDALEVEEV